MLSGTFYILLFYFLGETVSYLTGRFIPGSVIGMVLLFLALVFRLVSAERIGPVAHLLIRNMVFFFIPASVGIIASFDILSRNLTAIAAASAASTVLIIAVVGVIQQKMEDRRGGRAR